MLDELLGKKRELTPASFKQFQQGQDDKILEEFQVFSKISLSKLGGFKKQKEIIIEKVGMVTTNWEIMKKINTDYIKTFLVSGPPGCGKTTLVQSIASEFDINLYQVVGPQIVSSYSGESESKLRRLFNKLKEINQPSILFIDEIDTIIGKRENSKDMESRIVAQLKSCIESLNATSQELEHPIFIFGATNKPEYIEASLRRSGIFDVEIEIGYPQPEERKEILAEMIKLKNKKISETSLNNLAELTSGYVTCDLIALVKQAGMVALKRISKFNYLDYLKSKEIESYFDCNDAKSIKSQSIATDLETKDIVEANPENEPDYQLCDDDFEQALSQVKPNTLREGFTVIPNVTWDDIGGLEVLRQTLILNVVKPIKCPALFKMMNINNAGGVLLFGPPGCGKTLLAKAVSNASSANFISVKGPELLNKYVGESEKAVRELFKRAKNSQPCVIFFDEFDSLAPKRSSDNNAATDRVVNQLLTLMDGFEERQQVFLIAATNRPDMIDDAMLREGRLGTKLYVPLPDQDDRLKILLTLTRHNKFNFDLEELASRTENYSGADLSGIIRQAKLNFIKRMSESDCETLNELDVIITREDVEESLKDVKPSVSSKDISLYKSFRNMFKA